MSHVFKDHNLLIWLEQITKEDRNKNVEYITEDLTIYRLVGHCQDCDFYSIDWQPVEGLSGWVTESDLCFKRLILGCAENIP